MKKTIAIALLFLMTLPLLSGCGKKDTAGETAHLVWLIMGDKPKDYDQVFAKVNEYTKEKINATVEMKFMPWDTYATKVDTMTMSGEQWDICFTSFWSLNYASCARKGLFYPLNDLLKEYGQGIEKCVPRMPLYLDGTKISGKIYGIPVINGEGYQQAWYFNQQTLDKLGIDVSKAKQLEDLYPMFDKFRTAHPNDVCIDQYWWPLQAMYDYPVDVDMPGAIRLDDASCKIFNQYEDPAYIKEIKRYRGLYLKGYAAKEKGITPTGDLVRLGRMFCKVDTYNSFSARDWSACGDPKVPIVAVPIQTEPVAKSSEISLGSMMAINAQSAHPEAAMKLINLLYTDKYLVNLISYGVEGVNFQRVGENNMKQLNDKYGITDWLYGCAYLKYIPEGIPGDKWKIMQEHDKTAIISSAFGFIPDLQPVTNEVSAMKNVVEQYAQIIKKGWIDPDKGLADFNAKLKVAGLDKYLAEMQKQIDEWKKTKANGSPSEKKD